MGKQRPGHQAPRECRSYHEKGFPDTQVFQPLKQTRRGVETGSYEILIPNTLFEEELLKFTEAQKRAMLRGGLKVIDLPGERVLRAQQVVRPAPQLSARSDCSVPGKGAAVTSLEHAQTAGSIVIDLRSDHMLSQWIWRMS
jgi:hypothetical protein